MFVTTKLWNKDQGYDSALLAFEASRQLLHWPVPGRRLEFWQALERLLADGRARAFGVSNFMVPHLDELLARAHVVPAVNQIELSPFLQQREVRARCAERGIAVEAYRPLTRRARLGHPVVTEIAAAIGKSSAQVMLRWGVQRGFIVLPKSVQPDRIAENAALFDFTLRPEDMARLDALEQGLVTGWDPRDAP